MPHFRVSPQVLGPLGAEQLQDPALAVLELVKNAWDADANVVRVTVRTKDGPLVMVEDDGHGMTRAEFEDRWLVIGASYKRTESTSRNGRPLIGEKGLGRLSSFALGDVTEISSKAKDSEGFKATIDWNSLKRATSIDKYAVAIEPRRRGSRGTTVTISSLRFAWQSEQTDYLVSHAQFLASIPGEPFEISLNVDGQDLDIDDPLQTIEQLTEGSLTMTVLSGGAPQIVSCFVSGNDASRVTFRKMSQTEQDARLAGIELSLKFFLRDEATTKLNLSKNEVKAVLERYQGVRIYRDGINVPPYGLNGNDWARLEKQRTSTGGPTLTPGNSQLVGELKVKRHSHPHLVITAGRSGFADQSAVESLARYVRWAVRELGTARRAEYLGLLSSGADVPARVDLKKGGRPGDGNPKDALGVLLKLAQDRNDADLADAASNVQSSVSQALIQSEHTLRLYAQLASSGIAATSFAHELRGDFDVVTEAVSEIARIRRIPDRELTVLLDRSWQHIRVFASLFKVLPVKLRRRLTKTGSQALKKSIARILALAPQDQFQTKIIVGSFEAKLVPAEFDAICLNLVSNSIKAVNESKNRSKGKILVRLTKSSQAVELRVADNGSGLTPDVRRVMFEPLEGRFAEGTGMGLPIVKFLAERYRGAVDTTDAPEGFSTEFRVTFRSIVL